MGIDYRRRREVYVTGRENRDRTFNFWFSWVHWRGTTKSGGMEVILLRSE